MILVREDSVKTRTSSKVIEVRVSEKVKSINSVAYRKHKILRLTAMVCHEPFYVPLREDTHGGMGVFQSYPAEIFVSEFALKIRMGQVY